MSLPWRYTDSGLELVVRLTPKGGQDQIDGIGKDSAGKAVLRVRVATPPVDGSANKALIKVLAKTCGIAKSRIHFSAGKTSRVKRLTLAGEADALAASLEAVLKNRAKPKML